MEPRLGYELGHVVVHRDGLAAESTRAVNADAYTVGNHVVFGAQKRDIASSSGRALLGHELAHVVQQSRGGQPAPAPLIGGALEQAASQAGSDLSHGSGAVSVAGASGPVVYEQGRTR
jgi:hypothetical protein